jgi:histidinol-phosphate aminotransferase
VSTTKPASGFLDRLRPEIRNLPAYNSGLSAEYVRARYGVEHVAKLGSNENPWGTSPAVLDAIAMAVKDAALYPEPSSDKLRERLAARTGIAPGRLAFGNGSEDLIAVCAHAFLAPGDEMVTIAPSFGLHPIYAQAAGATVRAVRVRDDYWIDVPGILDALTPRTRMLMFSAPSNPAGTTISGAELRELLSALGSGTLLVLDEAYFEYASQAIGYESFLHVLEASSVSWILLRTFSKAYGLAGLRVGYGIASDASLIDIVDRVRTPFNVNRLAQAGALAAIEAMDFVRDCVLKTIAERERVATELVKLGYRTAPSVANFLFFDAREYANAFAERLLEAGVIVKPWREPGFETHVRVSIGSPRANDQFLAALSGRS